MFSHEDLHDSWGSSSGIVCLLAIVRISSRVAKGVPEPIKLLRRLNIKDEDGT